MNPTSSFLLLVRRGLRQHLLASLLAALLVALATGGFVTVWNVRREAQRAFTGSVGEFDAVLGARGSPLQLVLAALFHLEAPPGLVDAAEVGRLRAHPAVASAYPLAMGDNYQGWRVVGAPAELLGATEWLPGRRPQLASGGRLFAEDRAEAVIGNHAARRLGVKLGDRIHPSHGLDHAEEADHEESFEIVGVLEPTGTPLDRVIWIPLEELQHLAGHGPHAAESVSAILVKLRPEARALGFQLDREYNRSGQRYTFAWPVAAVLTGLFERFLWFDRVLALGAAVAGGMAALCVLVALHGSMQARRRDWAILRALGAPRGMLLRAVLGEAAAIGAGGAVLGVIVHLGLGALIAGAVQAQTGVLLELPRWDWTLVCAPAAMVALCALAGLWPAWRACATPVAANLAPVS
ncbi:MAG TPA: FtsX-like permease family protein [Opitutaceae bacterium]|nr:FtsX-like permease family protein [Opitutaceae bacterium]